jgi:hypothetical protein
MGCATHRPAAVLLRAGAVPAVIVGTVVAAGFAVSSLTAAGSVLVGTCLALMALSAGPALLALIRSASPPAAMLLAMIVYGIVVVVLAAFYLQSTQWAWLSGGPVGAGIGAATLSWLVGMIRAVPRLRIPVFGVDEASCGGAGLAVRDGSSASPLGSPH